MDHHSTIFSIFAIYCFILGIEKNKNSYWFFIPIFLVFSFLSKQIPAAYIIIFILFMSIFFLYYNFDLKKIYSLLLGSFFILFIFFFVLLANQIPFDNFFVQYFLYPMSIGSNRVEGLTFSLKEFIGQFKYIYICLLPLLAILLKII